MQNKEVQTTQANDVVLHDCETSTKLNENFRQYGVAVASCIIKRLTLL